jgi:hypothetical protein
MSNAAPQQQGLADDDPSVVRAEGRLRLLRELTEIGMKLARGLEPCAPAAAEKKRAARRHEAAAAKEAEEREVRVRELVAEAAEAEIPDNLRVRPGLRRASRASG